MNNRNVPCLCGSGKKFKDCCLGKPHKYSQDDVIKLFTIDEKAFKKRIRIENLLNRRTWWQKNTRWHVENRLQPWWWKFWNWIKAYLKQMEKRKMGAKTEKKMIAMPEHEGISFDPKLSVKANRNSRKRSKKGKKK